MQFPNEGLRGLRNLKVRLTPPSQQYERDLEDAIFATSIRRSPVLVAIILILAAALAVVSVRGFMLVTPEHSEDYLLAILGTIVALAVFLIGIERWRQRVDIVCTPLSIRVVSRGLIKTKSIVRLYQKGCWLYACGTDRRETGRGGEARIPPQRLELVTKDRRELLLERYLIGRSFDKVCERMAAALNLPLRVQQTEAELHEFREFQKSLTRCAR